LPGKKHEFTHHNTGTRLGLLVSPNLGHQQLKSVGGRGGAGTCTAVRQRGACLGKNEYQSVLLTRQRGNWEVAL